MALYIILRNRKTIQWHIGEVKPTFWNTYTYPQEAITNLQQHAGILKLVCEVQADGDELEFILSNFQNIPLRKADVVRWFGETAQFIAANL